MNKVISLSVFSSWSSHHFPCFEDDTFYNAKSIFIIQAAALDQGCTTFNLEELSKDRPKLQTASFSELSLEHPCPNYNSQSCSSSRIKTCLSGQVACVPNEANYYESKGWNDLSEGLLVENLFLHDEWEITINLRDQAGSKNSVIFRVREANSKNTF